MNRVEAPFDPGAVPPHPQERHEMNDSEDDFTELEENRAFEDVCGTGFGRENLLRIRTEPAGAEVLLEGRSLGNTTSYGLSVPWNEGPITIKKPYFRSETLNYTSPPALNDVLIKLRPIIPWKPAAVAGAILAVLAGVLVWTHLNKRPEMIELLIVTAPDGTEVFLGDDVTPVGVTDSSGRLRVKIEGPSDVSLRFAKENYLPVIRKFHVDRTTAANFPSVSLARAAGNLLVTTRQPGVSVTVNGKAAGETDADGKLMVRGVQPEVPIELTFTKDGFSDFSRKITIPPVEIYSLQLVDLERPRGSIEILSDPPLAEVFLDSGSGFEHAGRSDHEGRIVLGDLPVETPVHVKVVKEGYKEAISGPHVLTETEMAPPTIKIPLDKAAATMKIVTEPPFTRVKIDGQDAGYTGPDGTTELPDVRLDVPHTIEFRKEGYTTDSVSIVIPSSFQGGLFEMEKMRLAVDLTPFRAEGDNSALPERIELPINTDVPGVEIYFGNLEEPLGVTGDSGSLTVPFLGPGKLTLHFRKDEYEPRTIVYDVNARNAESFPRVEMKRVEADSKSDSEEAPEETIITTEPAPVKDEQRSSPSVELSADPAMPTALDAKAEAEKIQNPGSEFQVQIWTERGNGKYGMGEDLVLLVKANRDAHLNVIDIGTSGKCMLLFPNDFHRSNLVLKDQIYRIPPEKAHFCLRTGPPAGENYVKAIATLEDFDCIKSRFLESAGEFREIKEPAEAIRHLSSELQKLAPDHWAAAQVKITIQNAEQGATASTEPRTSLTPAGEQPGNDGIHPGLERILEESRKIRNDSPDFRVKLGTERHKTAYAVGESISLTFDSDQDCHVTILHIGSNGRVHSWFPNRWHQSDKIRKGAAYKIPPEASHCRLIVQGPEGMEYVKVIASREPLQVLQGPQAKSVGDFKEIRNPDMLLRAIKEELSKQDPTSWSETEFSFRIIGPK